MSEPFLRFLRVGVFSRMLWPDIGLVSAVTSVNVDKFNTRENTVTFLMYSQQIDTIFG